MGQIEDAFSQVIYVGLPLEWTSFEQDFVSAERHEAVEFTLGTHRDQVKALSVKQVNRAFWGLWADQQAQLQRPSDGGYHLDSLLVG